MKIKTIMATEGLGGYWYDDNEAIKRGAEQDGFTYTGEPVTPGFFSIRQPSRAVSIILELDSKELAFGDCTWVQYGGDRAGREMFVPTEEVLSDIHGKVEPWLLNQEITEFRSLMEDMDENLDLSRAIRYGVSQAILDAVAKKRRITMAEVLADEYGTKIENSHLTFFTQFDHDYHHSVDKMILRKIPVHPHALINSVPRLQRLFEYVEWTKTRIKQLIKDEEYDPILHYDLYGTLGLAYDNDLDKIIEYLIELEELSDPYKLQVEDPVYMSSKKDQMKMLTEIRKRIKKEGLKLMLVADEWVPTFEDKIYFIEAGAADIYQIKPPDLGGINKSIEAILYCKSKQVLPYLGGSCAETDRSAQASVHMALATQPHQVLVKPGMGIDEGLSIMYNEMRRALALIFRN